ncbi:MAG: DUF4397 domain-containing protein [Gemmatimonadota bacterium]
MHSITRTIAVLASGVFVTACMSRDAQTEDSVATATSEGAASTSISGDSADRRGVALVRVVNAVPTTSQLSVRSDETRQFDGVAYKEVTPYKSIDGTWVAFEVTGTSGGAYAPLATNRELLSDGHRYTLVVLPAERDGGFDTRILRDELGTDPAKVQLRVIHAARGVDEIDVVKRGGDEVFGDVNFSNEAGFKSIDPWRGTLEIRNADGGRVLATVADTNFEGGKSYTVVVTRKASGSYEAFWIEDVVR